MKTIVPFEFRKDLFTYVIIQSNKITSRKNIKIYSSYAVSQMLQQNLKYVTKLERQEQLQS